MVAHQPAAKLAELGRIIEDTRIAVRSGGVSATTRACSLRPCSIVAAARRSSASSADSRANNRSTAAGAIGNDDR